MISLFKQTVNHTLTIAHRGASSLAPENTRSAAKKAFELGADMWELDIRMSADGELIVFHDKVLSRTSNIESLDRFRERRPWPVHQFTLSELKEVDTGSWFIDMDPFKQIRSFRITEEEARGYRGEQILTLKEALDFSKEKNFPVNVEIKDLSESQGGERIVQKLADLIVEMNMADQVLVSSFNHEYLMKLKDEQSDISTAALVGTSLPNPIGLLKRLKADAIHLDQKVVTPELIKKVKGGGYFVNVYTVNDEESMHYFKRLGVSGIITDFPQMSDHFLIG